jgi:hypothetical protein
LYVIKLEGSNVLSTFLVKNFSFGIKTFAWLFCKFGNISFLKNSLKAFLMVVLSPSQSYIVLEKI